MNLNFEREDQNIPRLVITGSTADQHGKIKSMAPPAGIPLKATLEHNDKGVPMLVITLAEKPSPEQVGEVIPETLDQASLEVLCATQGIDPDDKAKLDLLNELAKAAENKPEFTD